MPRRADPLPTIRQHTGLTPFSESDRHAESLTLMLGYHMQVKGALKDWLVSQGILKATVATARNETLAKGFVHRRYLAAWRSKVNPLWDDMEESPEGEPEAPTATTGPGLTEAAVRAIAQDVTKGAMGTLTDHATTTARDATAATLANLPALVRSLVAEALPPRTIEVRDTATGTIRAMGLQHSMFPTLIRAAQARDHKGHRLNIWLTGPTGSGKTSAAEAVAKALGLPFGTDGSLDADYKVLGFRDANGNIISTAFLKIYAEGGVYVADEIDNWLPSALLSLNAALANGFVNTPSGLITRHPDCCVIACANTWGQGATNEYVGRAKQDAATLDRFQPKIHWPLDERLERAIVEAQSGEVGLHWHSIVRAARAAVMAQGLKIIISPRATISGAALLRSGFSAPEVIDMTFAAGLSPDQRETILSAVTCSGALTYFQTLEAAQDAPAERAVA